MTLREADAIFASPARMEAVGSLLKDRKVRRMSLPGLAGSAAAMLFAALDTAKSPLLVIADDMTDAGYLYKNIVVSGSARLTLLRRFCERMCLTGFPAPLDCVVWSRVPRLLPRKWPRGRISAPGR